MASYHSDYIDGELELPEVREKKVWIVFSSSVQNKTPYFGYPGTINAWMNEIQKGLFCIEWIWKDQIVYACDILDDLDQIVIVGQIFKAEIWSCLFPESNKSQIELVNPVDDVA